ncbi:DUF2306 domain-containing protein [Nonomuraea sp. NN258]|nr:DUF2306 domain-containing protein [Nonomuraea antri]
MAATAPGPRPRASRRGDGRLAVAGLIALTVVPLIGGAVRLTELFTGADVTSANARFFDAPTPVILHIFAASGYGVLGAFQFARGFRRRRPGWHRVSGRLLVPLGLVVALSGLWMTLFYAVPAVDRGFVAGMRVGFSSVMALSIVLGLAAVLRRDIARHRAWMIRAYAIAMGAGTQAFTHVPWFLTVGEVDATGRALAMGAGWAINLLVAEWVIRRGAPRGRSLTPVRRP